MNLEDDYKQLVLKALASPMRPTRNAFTRAFFGAMIETDLLETGIFPIISRRKIHVKGIVGELAAFLQGATSVSAFKDFGCNYWDSWADKEGKLNIDYGTAWRDFNGTDQLTEVVESLKNNPNSRRHMISSWRPDRLDTLALPCCHYSYQWFVTSEGYLEMIWNQRSVDLMVGLPSDIVLASLFNVLMAQTVGLKPGKITMMLGDCHVYESHGEGIEEFLSREDTGFLTNLAPEYTLNPEATVFNFKPEMFELIDYTPLEAINFKLEV